MTPEQLDRETWISAGLDALERGGVAAIAVVPLARELGVTRGSFYWHFRSREELLIGVLGRWEREHSDAVLDQLERVQDPAARLRALFERSGSKAPSYFDKLLDAGDDPRVTATLDRVAERRRDVIARACRQLGMTPAQARRHARLCYAAYVGLARLQRDEPALAPRERAAFTRHVVATLVPAD